MLGYYFYSTGNRSGSIGVGNTTTPGGAGYAPFYGGLTTSTNALPVSLVNSDLVKNIGGGASRFDFIPHFQMMAHTAVSSF
jgi:hypothetical protein